jgi:two-component sensor histidine kinase
MRKIFTIISLVFFTTNFLQAQTDCNCNQINEEQIDELINNNDSSAIYKTINKLKQGVDKICFVIANDIEVSYLIPKKKIAEALTIIQEQEKLINGLSCKTELIIHSQLNYAKYYKINQDYEGLSRYGFKALETTEARKDKKNEFKAITYIVHLFTRQDQGEKNWNYVKRAEKLILTMADDYSFATNYNWLAFEYEQKYSTTERRSLMDSAMMYSKKALSAALKRDNYIEITRCYRVFESNAASKEDYKSAILNIDSAIYYFKKIKVPANPASLYLTKALDYQDSKNYIEAQKWADTSVYYTEKFEGRTPATLAVYGQAAKIFEGAGNLPRTIATLKIYNKIKDSVFKQERLEKINELEEKYNKSKNEKTIKELAQQKSIYLLLALAGLLGIAAIGFFLRQQSLKHKKNILETEQRLNRARMNPHFFFNALTTLQKFALRDNNGQAMASNLSKFSNIMRETLESTYKEYVTIEQEMEFLNEYLEVQKIRFPQTFSYEVNADKDLDIDELQIPAMIIQPFVENSIEHGFVGVDYPGKVTINFTSENKELMIQINDNGKGLNTTAKEKNEHISRASQIIKDRIYLLNIKLKTKAGFSIDNNSSGNGVVVKIHLPLLYKDKKNT